MNHLFLLALLTVPLSPILAQGEESGELAQQIRQGIAAWDTGESPGGVIAVLRGGEPILIEGFGWANMEEEVPITSSTPFYLASLAKPITAFCAMHASRAGKLDLDAPLGDLFPELSAEQGAATLRQAMHHTSGLLDVYDAAIIADLPFDQVASNARAMDLLSRCPELSFPAGSRFLYCNSGYVLLAEALKRSTGQGLAAYAREHLFLPFEMEQARYLGESGEVSEEAHSYRRSSEGWERMQVLTGLHGPGGLRASMDDLIAFERGLRERVDPELSEDLRVAPAAARHPRLGRYAAGWMLQTYGGLPVERHPGGAFGFSSDRLRFPEEDVTILALVNAADLSATSLTEAVADLVLGDQMKAVEASAPGPFAISEGAARAFAGLWRSPTSNDVWILLSRPPGFRIVTLGDLKLDLLPVDEQRLEAVEAEVPFAVELHEGVLTVQMDGEILDRLEALDAPPRDAAGDADCAGSYSSASLDATIHFEALAGGGLRLLQADPILHLPPFQAFAKDLYLCDAGARIDFHRDDAGQVTGLTIDANRAWGLEFRRVE